MKTETIEYRAKDTPCKGYLAYEEFYPFPQPIVIIAHTWQGLNTLIKEKAHEIAKLGYLSFAADVYGSGQHTESIEEAAKLMMPLFLNRQLLRERISAAYSHALTLTLGDKQRVAALGFCFGGLTVIELLRSEASLRACVSCHGVLGNRIGEHRAQSLPHHIKKGSSLMILHGIKDQLVSIQDLLELQKEMSEAHVDWQSIIYGDAGHGFTNPQAHDKQGGMYFEPLANERSFQAIKNYFIEKLK